jgi:hypothetical protein
MLGTVTAIAASPTASGQPAAMSSAPPPPPQQPFGRNETVSDLSVVARTIGVSEADLQTADQSPCQSNQKAASQARRLRVCRAARSRSTQYV